ncbi:tRNA-guanine transglycosylase [Gorillibacterium sp. sgz5001074]|uniref:tRNA-guanine transglycosylase n=1 Tax=Gorillibacterium sp. sgz5001074 TaxID=3446695 RepID=UPI003F67453A
MQFYVGWSHSDALFSDYYSDCPTLVSAVSDNQGTLKRFKNKPNKLIIDCGSVFYVKQQKRPTLKHVFEIQRSLIDECPNTSSIRLVHFDEPMFNKTSLSDQYYAMERTLYNAYEYLKVVSEEKLPVNVSTMGVIQGFDRASVHYSANELKKMGYRFFGIGSLLAKNQKQQIEFIKYAIEAVGAENLHVFGVTGITQMAEMVRMRVASFDSTRPTMAAAYYQVFYSNPFRTYVISASRAKPQSDRLGEPLYCECPVCKENPQDMFIPSPRPYMRLRSIHNYYHLVKTIEKMKVGTEREEVV